MRRTALEALKAWQKARRVPLLLRGARQVGKTWLVRELAGSFSSFLEINLEAQPEVHQTFRDFFGKPLELVRALALLSGKKIVPGETLLFLDEIQVCKEALLSLRYFKEQLSELHVIAAGSLLEFSIKELSFPVGRIDFFHLFPLNFLEYLQGIGRKDLVEAIRQANEAKPLPDAVHQSLLEQVAIFCLIGGMPEVVATYIQTKNLQECQAVQQRLIANYREDFYKYARRTQIDILRMVFDGVPRLLGQKLKYSNIDPAIRSRELGAAFQLLLDAGLAHKVCHTSAQGLPLSAQIHPSQFKAYFLDVGLAQRLLGLNLSQLFPERKKLLANRGAIAEQFVAQELLSFTPSNQTPQLHYWHRESKSSQAEVDFVIEHDAQVLPIEVKSQRSRQMKSLHLFLEEHQPFSAMGLKVSAENFHRKEKIRTIPFYALFKLFR